MKWGALRPDSERFDFAQADELISFAKKHRMRVRGHTLLWPGADPSWVRDKVTSCELARAVLRQHIEAVVTRYAGDIDEWDVANEVLDARGKLKTDESPFLKQCGEAILADAFRWTAELAPQATLFFNDFSMEDDNARVRGYAELITRLRSAGVPVGGMGLETHLRVRDGIPVGLRSVLRGFDGMGIKTALTEVDVRIDLNDQSESQKELQSQIFASVAQACRVTVSCTGVTLWGFTDKYSWVEKSLKGQGAATVRDSEYNPKPAYFGLQSGLAAAR